MTTRVALGLEDAGGDRAGTAADPGPLPVTGLVRPIHLMATEDEGLRTTPIRLVVCVVLARWRRDPDGDGGSLLALPHGVALGSPAASGECRGRPRRTPQGRRAEPAPRCARRSGGSRAPPTLICWVDTSASFFGRPPRPSRGHKARGRGGGRGWGRSSRTADRDPCLVRSIGNAFAVAGDPAAATGTVGERREEPEPPWWGSPAQAARGAAAASLRTIGTSFRFSGSSRSSVRPRYVSLLR